MTVDLSENLVEELRKLAAARSLPFETLVDEAIREYLVSTSITDITPDDVASTAMGLTPELGQIEQYDASDTSA